MAPVWCFAWCLFGFVSNVLVQVGWFGCALAVCDLGSTLCFQCNSFMRFTHLTSKSEFSRKSKVGSVHHFAPLRHFILF